MLKEGTARVPSDVGVATDMTLDRIQLDDKRTYEIADEVESFATRSHHIRRCSRGKGSTCTSV